MYVSINGPGDLDLLTLKLVYDSHQRWRTFIPNLGTLGLWVYVRDGLTDRKKTTLIAHFSTGGGIIRDVSVNIVIICNFVQSI